MTYLAFHFVFTVPPLLVLILASWHEVGEGRPLAGVLGRGTRFSVVVLALHVLMALLYTTPWDNHLVASGVWGYGRDRVLFTLGYVPIEEYAFFVLQTLLTGLFVCFMARRAAFARVLVLSAPLRSWLRGLGALFWLGLAAFGVFALRQPAGTYVGLIAVWAAPVLAFQWAFGGDLLVARAQLLIPALTLPTLYLWLADRVALALGIWWIDPVQSLALRPFGLPVEEALFFLLTNLLIGYGLTLAHSRVALERFQALRQRLGAWWHGAFGMWALTMIPIPLVPDLFAPIAYISTGFLALGTLGYALARYGRRAWLLFALSFGFGLLVEWFGSSSGFPFGVYRYTAPGPRPFGVPLLVPLGWWAFTMIALAVSPHRYRLVFAPLALVAWDLALDPLMVSQGFWVFAGDSPYHGIPMSNFVGWYGAGLVLVALMLRLEPRLADEAGLELRLVFVVQAFLMSVGLAVFGLYLAAGVTLVAMGLLIARMWVLPARHPLRPPS